jgi:hypothetical protein
LGPLTDVVLIRDGAPGTGRFPVLEKSPAIDHGNNEVCSSDPMLVTDQLGQPRSVAGELDGPRVCDIGAVEFFPVVNNLVQLREVFTRYDPTPRPPWAPEEPDAGTFVITAKFENISNQIIFYPFFEVISIEGVTNPPPQLLNTGRAPGTVGARMTPEGSLTTPLEPGQTGTFQFVIGLQLPRPFTFFVDMLGEPRTSNASVSAQLR